MYNLSVIIAAVVYNQQGSKLHHILDTWSLSQPSELSVPGHEKTMQMVAEYALCSRWTSRETISSISA
jgi:hypothetical protein